MKPIFFIMFLLSVSIAGAYPRVNVYTPNVNSSQIAYILETIPERYFQGVPQINFYDKWSPYLGYYHFGGVIDIYVASDSDLAQWVLIHELAHREQERRRLGHLQHNRDFDLYIYDIWNSSNLIISYSELYG